MPIGGIIAGAGALAGGLIGANAAGDAAQTQANAARSAQELEANQFRTTQTELNPFRAIGTKADDVLAQLFGLTSKPGSSLNGLFKTPISGMPGVGAPPSPTDPNLVNQFQASPGYQYALQQSGNAIQNSAAGRTGAISGNMLTALQTNATGLANQDYGNFYNNLVNNYGTRYNDAANNRNQIINVLSALGGQGQNAAAQLGGFGQNAVSSIGNNLNLGASATAAGQIGSANAITNSLNSLSGNSSVNSALSFLLNGSSGGDYGGGTSSGLNYGGGDGF